MRRVGWLLVAGWIPVGGGLAVLGAALFGNNGVILAGAYFVLVFVWQIQYNRIPCPHCGARLVRRNQWFIRKCPSCGIRIGTPRSELVEAAEVLSRSSLNTAQTAEGEGEGEGEEYTEGPSHRRQG